MRHGGTNEHSKGIGCKIQNKAQQLGGKTNEALGKASNENPLQAEGMKHLAEANTKQAAELAKDATKDITGNKQKTATPMFWAKASRYRTGR